MQVSVEKTSGLERRLTVGVPAEEVDNEVAQRLQKAAKTVRISGFRPGKVPLKVVRQRFGVGVRQEVVGEIMNRSLYEAITKEELQPAGQPQIEPVKNEPGVDLEYVAVFEVYPDIELQDFSSIEITRPVADITEEDIDGMIDNLRKQRADWVEVERPAETKDRVNIDYTGTVDGEAFEGGSATDSDLVIGSGRMIPGFEDAIVDMTAGEEKNISLTFPEDYHAENLRGKAVEFAIKLNRVSEQQLPDLNDEFFAQFGVTEGGEEKFRADVRNNMERELAQATKAKVKNRLFKALDEMHTVDIPAALIRNETQAMRQQMLSQFAGAQQIDPSIFPDDIFAPEANKRVRLGLLIAEIAKTAELEPSADKVRERIEEMAATYEQPDQVIQYYYSNQQALQSIESAVLEDAVAEYVLSSAQVTDEPASYQDAVTPDRPEEAETDTPVSDDADSTESDNIEKGKAG